MFGKRLTELLFREWNRPDWHEIKRSSFRGLRR